MLTDREIKNARPKEKRYELRDTNGLVLDITPNGVKTWRYRYYYQGKDYKLTLGPYPLISLKEARDLRDEARVKRARGENPAKATDKPITFGELFEDFKNTKIKKLSKSYAESYDVRVNRILWHHKDTPVKDITSNDILLIVREMEAAGTYEQARRVKQIYGQVIRYGIAIGVCDYDPTAALRGALSSQTGKHYSTITDPQQVGALLRAIDAYSSPIVGNALKFHAYTFVRPGELRKAEWAEVDLGGGTWKIPAEKMKMKRVHVVPLSRQAVKILEDMQKYTGSCRYIFPSPRARAVPMSEVAELAAIRAMGYTKEQFVPHGFRGMASTLLHENGWPSDYIEKQLAHEIGSNVAKAYNHAQYLEKRTEMMQWWADYLDSLKRRDS